MRGDGSALEDAASPFRSPAGWSGAATSAAIQCADAPADRPAGAGPEVLRRLKRAGTLFARAFLFRGDWARVNSTLEALDGLSKERVGEILAALTDPKTARVRTVLLTGREHNNATEITPTFTDREAWKKTREFN